MKQNALFLAVLLVVGSAFFVHAQNPKGQPGGVGAISGVPKANSAENTLPSTQVVYGDLNPGAKHSLPMLSLYGAQTQPMPAQGASNPKTLDAGSKQRLNLTSATATEDPAPAGLRLVGSIED
jgi:hypothetical protein